MFKNKNRLFASSATLIWFFVNLYLAAGRSLSSDEWPKFDYVNKGLVNALLSHFGEYAPYAPGEILLGYISKLFLGDFLGLPNEVWSRMPALAFGAGTVLVVASSNLWYALLPLCFSVALTSFSTQFQPYSAMMFGGAIAFSLMCLHSTKEREPTWIHRAALFNLIFGHLYGICFVAMAYFFRKRWRIVVASSTWIVGILIIHHFLPHKSSEGLQSEFPPLLQVTRQIAGSISNPHKAAYFYLPLCVFGLLSLFSTQKFSKLFQVLCFFSATILAPILASKLAKYMFMPRQVIGAAPGLLILAGLGYTHLTNRTASQRIRRLVVPSLWALNILCAVGPWVAYVRGIPPFVDQPLHRLKQITRAALEAGAPNLLFTDTTTSASAERYVDWQLGSNQRRAPSTIRLDNLSMTKTCWTRLKLDDFCIYALGDSAFLFDGERKVMESQDLKNLLTGRASTSFYGVVHATYAFPNLQNTNTRILRAW